MNQRNWARHGLQSLWFLITNSYFEGFAQGKIYTGPWKQYCVPGMNCYSCPGAKGACPIGALQAVIGSFEYRMSYYVVGFLFVIGALMGRLVCGFLCPFGLIQDLLHKIPFPKKIKTFKGDPILRYGKYGFLLLFVILMPLFLVDVLGQGSPYFCKLVCPVGMLEGGIPLVLKNETLKSSIGALYAWKGTILAVTIFLSILLYRPFCKYVCPLGAIYALFNSSSLFAYKLDHHKCIHCGACHRVCDMDVNPVENCNATECIRCGKCKNICPVDAIENGVYLKDRGNVGKKARTQS